MNLDARSLRPYVPLLMLVATIGLGWIVFVRPLVAEHATAATRIEALRQREMLLIRESSTSAFAPRATTYADPATVFERQVAAEDASPALLEHLARLASAARARNLLIETVETGAGGSVPPQTAALRDPRFALFDLPVSHVPIRLAFDTDFASVGRFLWAFRDLPTTAEIRALSIGLPAVASGEEAPAARTGVLRVSLTLHAYSRSAPSAIQASSRRASAVTR
jgi:hypothetical protein